jgi:hypothetical protein
MLPRVPGVGVWRLETHGWNAATTLPGTLALLARAAAGEQFLEAVLRLEQRSDKKGGQTRRYAVPVIDTPGTTMYEALAAATPNALAINVPVPAPAGKPELPPAPEPVPEEFEGGQQPGYPEPPTVPASVEILPGDEVLETIALQEELLTLSDELGVRQAANNSIKQNAEKNREDYAKHKTWLKGQITRAKTSLEGRLA